jgi:hypothetical protein
MIPKVWLYEYPKEARVDKDCSEDVPWHALSNASLEFVTEETY